jgi:DNA-binding response OmpR family regulator
MESLNFETVAERFKQSAALIDRFSDCGFSWPLQRTQGRFGVYRRIAGEYAHLHQRWGFVHLVDGWRGLARTLDGLSCTWETKMNLIHASMKAVKAPLRVLILEDDELLRDHVLVPQLQRFGFEITAVGTAAEMDPYTRANWPDILILDVGLPDGDGFELTCRLRAKMSDVGIVMLTGRNSTADRIRGLSEGADAYLSKPVDTDLLAATLYSVARRLRALHAQTQHQWRLDADDWCLLSPSGGMVALTKTEGRLLSKLLEKHNQSVSRDELIKALTPNVYDFDPHRLDSLIHRLRKKVQRVLGVPLPLTAVHGEGYVFLLM